MTQPECAPFTVFRPGLTPDASDPSYTVVWLRGEHDLATRVSLVTALTGAARRDDADLLVDLSEVTFMDASTIGALVMSRNRLRSRSQSLQVRAPSPAARRVLDLCGLAHLVHPATTEAIHLSGGTTALSTWGDLPSAPPCGAIAEQREPDERCQPARPVTTAGARSSQSTAILEVDRNGR